MRNAFWSNAAAVAIIVAMVALMVRANLQHRRGQDGSTPAAIAFRGARADSTTSRTGLQQTIDRMQAQLRRDPLDAAAAVRLADALLRQARVTGNASLALVAEQPLARVLHDEPLEYDARRMLAAVYLSQHRFRDAIKEGERARDQRPTDDWNYGVIGDGHLELGEYDEAFAAFQKMVDLRPTAGAYARAAYALELQGRLEAAVESMTLATDATPPTDPESLAWHHAQLGDLYRQLGRLDDARYQYAWADYAFPGHPFAKLGLARVKQEEGDAAGALREYESLMTSAPTPDVAERLGDVYASVGRAKDAAKAYALAETGWRVDAPQPAMLARFLAEHGGDIAAAVRLAEGAAAQRRDIFTEDALAWCYFKAGRLHDAVNAIGRARRTGTKDRTILAHAAAIEAAAARAN